MSFAVTRSSEGKAVSYDDLASDLAGLINGEPDPIANLANMSSLLFHSLPDLNWAGFYLMKSGELVLGPFQGRPACIRIAVGRGVCGSAVERRESILVEDVHAFPGHIVCDEASRSELVVPLIAQGTVIGVLDLDSPSPGRFTDADRQGCEKLVALLLDHLDAGAVSRLSH